MFWRRKHWLSLALAAIALLSTGEAAAETRLALLIGNQDYPSIVGRLSRTHEDARVIGAALRSVGFETDVQFDLDRDGIDGALERFENRIIEAKRRGEEVAAFFYFSGHGAVAVDDGRRRNFLVPARASVSNAPQLIRRGMRLDQIIRGLAATEADAVFVVTDACRNELEPAFDRSGQKGFTPIGQRQGMLIASATYPGETAPDDGAFADALAAQIRRPAQFVERSFTLAFRDVAQTREGYQLPTLAAALREDFCFNGCPGETTGVGQNSGTPPPWRPSTLDLRAAQAELQRLQLYAGAIDGLWGSGSRSALAQFQRDQGISPADGAVTLASLEALRAAPTPKPASVQPRDFTARLLAEPRAGLKECDACPEMVAVPGGSFRMGSPSNEAGRQDNEGPTRMVRISQFALGRTEITRGEYRRFVEATGRSDGDGCWWWDAEKSDGAGWEKDVGRSWRGPGYSQTDSHPAVCVSWEDAQAYVGWLNRQVESSLYRLPSEAEQEYAIRAATNSAYFWGSDQNGGCGFANGNDVTSKRINNFAWSHSACDDGFAVTAPVGSFRANAYGLSDTVGSVWEWGQDCWNDSYSGAPTNGSAWMSGDCSSAVLRGGSWGNLPWVHRSAVRSRPPRDFRGFSFGFRVARTLN